ncbi:MAG: class I SAM-dependent methyltransferase [Chloroflexi bacterium]|nr:MAG: class I SAM-dependent methyltransferase [Chloroflexota bacterium]
MMNSQIDCPLCNSNQAAPYFEDAKRPFHHCPICSLVFVTPTHFLAPAAEKAEYDLHENDPSDAGYRRFLSRLFLPMQERLTPNSVGLDFGSGPGPTLSRMFAEVGHQMSIYDVFYAQETAVFNQTYDFITATEVVEHLHNPRFELNRLWSRLKPGGTLGIMTKLVIDRNAFAKWHYKNDLTHVSFFSRETFSWLAAKWQANLSFFHKDVILLQKENQ